MNEARLLDERTAARQFLRVLWPSTNRTARETGSRRETNRLRCRGQWQYCAFGPSHLVTQAPVTAPGVSKQNKPPPQQRLAPHCFCPAPHENVVGAVSVASGAAFSGTGDCAAEGPPHETTPPRIPDKVTMPAVSRASISMFLSVSVKRRDESSKKRRAKANGKWQVLTVAALAGCEVVRARKRAAVTKDSRAQAEGRSHGGKASSSSSCSRSSSGTSPLGSLTKGP
jgi:hypothetical protein